MFQAKNQVFNSNWVTGLWVRVPELIPIKPLSCNNLHPDIDPELRGIIAKLAGQAQEE